MNEYTLSIAHTWQGLCLESPKESQQVHGWYSLQAFISLQFMNSGLPFLVKLAEPIHHVVFSSSFKDQKKGRKDSIMA